MAGPKQGSGRSAQSYRKIVQKAKVDIGEGDMKETRMLWWEKGNAGGRSLLGDSDWTSG